MNSTLLDRPVVSSAPRTFYRPELDALRFFAFLAVFAAHVMPHDPAFYTRNHLPLWMGNMLGNAAWAGVGGVVLFFMLSSYLITSLLLREHDKTGSVALMAFYKRRALRIWPLYFTFLAFCLIVAPFIGRAMPPIHVLGFISFTENWVVSAHSLPILMAAPLWSLSVEEQFYLVWPPILLLVGVRRGWLAALACLPIAVFARWYMSGHGAESMLTGGAGEAKLWVSTTSHLDSIAVGALIAYAFRTGLPSFGAATRLALVICGAALPVIVRTGVPEVWRYPVVTLACALILLGTMGLNLRDNHLSSCLVHLGKISFGLYIFHMAFVLAFDALYPKLVFVAPAAFVCTVLAATASYRYLEFPFLCMKDRLAIIPSRSA